MLMADGASEESGVGGKASLLTELGVFDIEFEFDMEAESDVLFSVFSSRRESTRASSRETRSRRFFL